MFEWVNLFELGKAPGFVYFRALAKDGKAIAWISRTNELEPYTYSVFYVDGVNQVVTARGRANHAEYCIDGLVRHFGAINGGVSMEALELGIKRAHEIIGQVGTQTGEVAPPEMDPLSFLQIVLLEDEQLAEKAKQ